VHQIKKIIFHIEKNKNNEILYLPIIQTINNDVNLFCYNFKTFVETIGFYVYYIIMNFILLSEYIFAVLWYLQKNK